MTKKIIILSIATICLFAFFFFFGGENYDSVLIGILGGYCGALLIPQINNFYKIKKSTKEGIHKIQQNGIYSIDGLEISVVNNKDTKKSLIVSNTPAWIYKIQTDDLDEQMDLLISDFEILRKNKDWNTFIANKTVCFNLYSDESFIKEIVRTGEKQYE